MKRKSWLVSVTRHAIFVASLSAFASGAWALEAVVSEAGPEGPAQIVYAPEGKAGPVVILISGQSGPNSYRSYAEELAKLGYYAVLLTGKDILNPEMSGEGHLKKAIERAQRAPQAKPGKAAVIGFSLGGGGALYNAAPLADQVSMVVAYCPYTKSWVNKVGWFAKRFQVPVLLMAAQQDRYQECCLAETARAIDNAAKQNNKTFELVVYPDADHGFNLTTDALGRRAPTYRADDDRDAWRRTQDMLKRYQPLS